MSVGIPEIDDDHRQFISLISELNRSVTERMPLLEIRKRLQLLVDDAKRHFEHEERLFREWRYPDGENHALVHTQALNELRRIQEAFIPYTFVAEWFDAVLRIRDMMVNHILIEDMKYAEFCRSKI